MPPAASNTLQFSGKLRPAYNLKKKISENTAQPDSCQKIPGVYDLPYASRGLMTKQVDSQVREVLHVKLCHFHS